MDETNIALVAWEIVGVIVLLIAIVMVLRMIPEVRRYFKLKSM